MVCSQPRTKLGASFLLAFAVTTPETIPVKTRLLLLTAMEFFSNPLPANVTNLSVVPSHHEMFAHNPQVEENEVLQLYLREGTIPLHWPSASKRKLIIHQRHNHVRKKRMLTS